MRAAIARTKPNCHICGQPINYTLHHLDPYAYVIDHVTPLALGGTDTLDNVRAAHRICNSKKRSRLISPIVKRSQTLI